MISIHALREEGDGTLVGLVDGNYDFYPRPPRGGRPEKERNTMDGIENFYPRPPRGGRRFLLRPHGGLVGFLSTPSARRATRRCPMRSRFIMYFYPRPPRGGRLFFAFQLRGVSVISIHALREEGDFKPRLL